MWKTAPWATNGVSILLATELNCIFNKLNEGLCSTIIFYRFSPDFLQDECSFLSQLIKHHTDSLDVNMMEIIPFILVTLVSWCYWWISHLDLLYDPSLPPSAQYWHLFHSLSCTVSLHYTTLCLFFVSTEPRHLCILYVANLEFNVSKGFCHKIIWLFNKVCVPRRGLPDILPPKQ